MRHSVWIALIALSGCAQLGPASQSPAPATATPGGDAAAPAAVAAPPPPPTARTVEQFDTTTEAQRAEAAAPPPASGARPLGTTIASLGDPTRPGFWIETPLATEEAPGRVVYRGQSAAVTLRPIDGPDTAGSRLSLAAMRLIGAPLTDLPEVEVFQD